MKAICSINGKISPLTEATIPVTSVEVEYGFGVYETIKVRNNIIYFLEKHVERLFISAESIKLQHEFNKQQISTFISDFVHELGEESCNLKVLLYGADRKENTKLFILGNAPFYPNRKWYKEGVKLKSFTYERWMPQAKTLNMLASYFFYKQVEKEGFYDALILDNFNYVIEGTRTNIFFVKGNSIYSPPKDRILQGVTLSTLGKLLEKNSEYKLIFKNLRYQDIPNFDGIFLTSTSSKILPVKQIDSFSYENICSQIRELIKMYDEALEKSKGKFELL